jgi:hypothetical protein
MACLKVIAFEAFTLKDLASFSIIEEVKVIEELFKHIFERLLSPSYFQQLDPVLLSSF